MKRRRSSAPGRLRPDGRWIRSLLPMALSVALAACGQAAATEPPPGVAPTVLNEAPAPSEPVAGEPTTEPLASVAPAVPGPETSELPVATVTQPAIDAGGASVCSGSDENRDFFASMAAAVDWTVYCPVLSDGWFVDDGRYRLAGGGWLQISYDGPGDARVILQQGAFCSTADGCVPSGRNVGPAAFGDRTGSMIAGDDGTWSVIVDQGANPSWLLVADGLGEDAVRQIGADLHPIAG